MSGLERQDMDLVPAPVTCQSRGTAPEGLLESGTGPPIFGERYMKSRAERGREALSLGWDHLAGASGGGMAFA